MKSVYFLIGSLTSGGAQRVVSNLTIELTHHIERNIILFGKESRITYPYQGTVIYLDKFSNKKSISRLVALLRRVHQLRRLKKMNRDYTFISFLEYPNLLNLLSGNYGRTIISVRNHMSSKYKSGLKAFLWNKSFQYLYGKAEKIIAVSEEIKRDLIYRYNIDENKIIVIYNSYSIEAINKLSKEDIEEKLKPIFDKPVVITVGRLNIQKGQWHLLRAFKRLSEKVTNVQLVILGEGELGKELSLMSEEMGISKSVHFLGFKENPFKYIARSKVFVLTSLYEGFPNALAEAMACGVPVVSSDCRSGPREILSPDELFEENLNYEIVNDRFGILVPTPDGIMRGAKEDLTIDEEILANHLMVLLENKELHKYFAFKALERIQNFSVDIFIKKWEDLIK